MLNCAFQVIKFVRVRAGQATSGCGFLLAVIGSLVITGTTQASTLLAALTSQVATLNASSEIEAFTFDIVIDYFGTPVTSESFTFSVATDEAFWVGSPGDHDVDLTFNITTSNIDPSNLPVTGVLLEVLDSTGTVRSDATDGDFFEKSPAPTDTSGFFVGTTYYDNVSSQTEAILFDDGIALPGDVITLETTINFEGDGIDSTFALAETFRLSFGTDGASIPEPSVAWLLLAGSMNLLSRRRSR